MAIFSVRQGAAYISKGAADVEGVYLLRYRNGLRVGTSGETEGEILLLIGDRSHLCGQDSATVGRDVHNNAFAFSKSIDRVFDG